VNEIKRNGLRVELQEGTLLRLLDSGCLCAADLVCLDCDSKRCLKELCLKSCARTLNPRGRPSAEPCIL